MDIAAALDQLGLTRGDLAYRGLYRGTHFMDNWLSLVPGDAGQTRLQSVTWLDSRVLGGPLPPQVVTLTLTIGRDGQPLTAQRSADGKDLAVDFTAGTALLPDGSTQPIEANGARHALDNNHPGLVALLVLLSPPIGGADPSTQVFLVSALTTVPYQLTRHDDGTLVSNFGETLRCDTQGRLTRIEAAGGVVVVERADPPPPHPTLQLQSPPPTAGYIAPAALAPRMQDIAIEVPGRGPLAATFTAAAHQTAAGILVLQGSGEVDRHGFAAGIDTGTATFADALAAAGLAVLRFDKRGVGQSRRQDDSLAGAGFRGGLDDAAAALGDLRRRIAPDAPVIVMGHSLGGLAALSLSVDRHAGALPLVLLATPGRSLPRLIRAQTLDQGRRLGLSEDTIADQLDELDHFLAYARNELQGQPVRASALAGRLAAASMADLSGKDPAALMQRQQAPVCLLQGARDIQVDATADFAVLQQAAQQAGVAITARLFPGLNHLFRSASPGEGLENYAQAGTVDTEAVQMVVSWCQTIRGRP